MDFALDGNAMDCHTLDQWSGIESLYSFFTFKLSIPCASCLVTYAIEVAKEQCKRINAIGSRINIVTRLVGVSFNIMHYS